MWTMSSAGLAVHGNLSWLKLTASRWNESARLKSASRQHSLTLVAFYRERSESGGKSRHGRRRSRIDEDAAGRIEYALTHAPVDHRSAVCRGTPGSGRQGRSLYRALFRAAPHGTARAGPPRRRFESWRDDTAARGVRGDCLARRSEAPR